MKPNDKKVEIIKAVVNGKEQKTVAIEFGYKSPSTVCSVMKAFKAEVKDYADSHSLTNTLEHFKDYSLNENWLNTNDITCAVDKETILRNYRNGFSVIELSEIYRLSSDEIREIIIEAKIPVREDEENTEFGEGFITVERNATDIFYELPRLHTYDIVWVKNAKFSYMRDKNTSNILRPAIVLSPESYLKHQKKANSSIQVIYGTTKIVGDNMFNLVVNKYYTGKETQYAINSIDTVCLEDINKPRENAFVHLNDADIKRLKDKLIAFFLSDNYYVNKEKQNEADGEINIDNLIINLFERGLDRKSIYECFNISECDITVAEIQSVLDKAGYGGIKKITAPETDNIVTPNETVLNVDDQKDKEIEILLAKLSVYESIFNKCTTNISV